MTTAPLTPQQAIEEKARIRCREAGHDPDCFAAKPSFARKADTPAGIVVLQGTVFSWRPLWTFYLA